MAAVRRGDERAFEVLYSRYQRRIHAYVLGMCKDHARAEDLTQEVFMSALRRMRETERPIAFKPWIYEIAKNACIDLFRRSRRAEEVSLEADDEFSGSELGRLAAGGPSPDAAVANKQALDQLCGAFGGLSDVHHEILVMRELEGLSYREIGERLGMSRPAVESTLFRARRRLTEEYDELVSGQRCQRVQRIIATASEGRLGARDTRKLARHVAHCQPCRREALAAGLEADALTQPLRTRVAAKVAGFLPFPWLARRFGARGGAGSDAVATAGGSGRGTPGWLSQLPMVSDQLGAGWGKAVAAAAVLVAGLGAGVGTNVVGASGAAHPPAPAVRKAATTSTVAASTHEAALPRAGSSAAGRAVMVAGRRNMAAGRRHARLSARRHHAARHGASSPSSGAGPVGAGSAPAAGGSNPVSGGGSTGSGGSGGSASAPSTPSGGGSGGSSTQPLQLPTIVQPASAPDPVSAVTAPIESAVAPVTNTVQNTVQSTVGPALDQVQDTVAGLAPPATR